MNRRVGLWTLIGFFVACAWVVIGFLTWPNFNLGRSPLVAITAPAGFVGSLVPLAFYWFILLNAAIYALLGLGIEALRPHYR
jgi:hypothetical protein